jgi:hypothetical protein
MKNILFYSVTLLFGANLLAQNVGIGTNTPNASAKLDIVDSNRGLLIPRVSLSGTNVWGPVTNPATSLLVYNTAIAGDVWPGFYYWNGTKWVRLDTGNGDWKLDGNTNGVPRYIGTNDNFDFPIRTNGTEKMRITAGGNVGIGTTAPQNKLDVRGVIQSAGPLAGTYSASGLELRATDNGNYWHIGYRGSSSGEQGNITYWYWNGTSWVNSLSLTPSGNVGIGTTAPGAKLHVFGTIASETASGSTAALYNVIGWGNAGRVAAFSGGGLHLQAYSPAWSVNQLYLAPNTGNVGIGTTNPVYKLDVYDNSDIAFIGVRANLANNGTQGFVGFQMNGSDQGWTIYQGDPDGGYGVGPRNFEIWEYPANPGTSGQCCRRRFIIENTFGLYTGAGPTNLILQNNGNVCSYGSFVSCSDVRLKKDFAKLDNILNKILTINTYYFHWNTSQFPEKFNDTTRQIGIKAQEIKELFPELVSQDSEGFYQVAYDKLSVLAIQSIKEQQKQIQDQQKIIQHLQEENFKIKQANLQLKDENNQIKAEMKLLNEKVDNLINSLSYDKKLVTTE